MERLVGVIWIGRLFYVTVTLAWTLSLWLWWIPTGLIYGSIEEAILGMLGLYFISMVWRRIVESSIGKFFLDIGITLPIGGLIGLVVFSLLHPYNSLSLTWLIAVICGLLAFAIVYRLLSWFESKISQAENLATKEKRESENMEYYITISALFWDRMMSAALPVFVLLWILFE